MLNIYTYCLLLSIVSEEIKRLCEQASAKNLSKPIYNMEYTHHVTYYSFNSPSEQLLVLP